MSSPNHNSLPSSINHDVSESTNKINLTGLQSLNTLQFDPSEFLNTSSSQSSRSASNESSSPPTQQTQQNSIQNSLLPDPNLHTPPQTPPRPMSQPNLRNTPNQHANDGSDDSQTFEEGAYHTPPPVTSSSPHPSVRSNPPKTPKKPQSPFPMHLTQIPLHLPDLSKDEPVIRHYSDPHAPQHPFSVLNTRPTTTIKNNRFVNSAFHQRYAHYFSPFINTLANPSSCAILNTFHMLESVEKDFTSQDLNFSLDSSSSHPPSPSHSPVLNHQPAMLRHLHSANSALHPFSHSPLDIAFLDPLLYSEFSSLATDPKSRVPVPPPKINEFDPNTKIPSDDILDQTVQDYLPATQLSAKDLLIKRDQVAYFDSITQLFLPKHLLPPTTPLLSIPTRFQYERFQKSYDALPVTPKDHRVLLSFDDVCEITKLLPFFYPHLNQELTNFIKTSQHAEQNPPASTHGDNARFDGQFPIQTGHTTPSSPNPSCRTPTNTSDPPSRSNSTFNDHNERVNELPFKIAHDTLDVGLFPFILQLLHHLPGFYSPFELHRQLHSNGTNNTNASSNGNNLNMNDTTPTTTTTTTTASNPILIPSTTTTIQDPYSRFTSPINTPREPRFGTPRSQTPKPTLVSNRTTSHGGRSDNFQQKQDITEPLVNFNHNTPYAQFNSILPQHSQIDFQLMLHSLILIISQQCAFRFAQHINTRELQGESLDDIFHDHTQQQQQQHHQQPHPINSTATSPSQPAPSPHSPHHSRSNSTSKAKPNSDQKKGESNLQQHQNQQNSSAIQSNNTSQFGFPSVPTLSNPFSKRTSTTPVTKSPKDGPRVGNAPRDFELEIAGTSSSLLNEAAVLNSNFSSTPSDPKKRPRVCSSIDHGGDSQTLTEFGDTNNDNDGQPFADLSTTASKFQKINDNDEDSQEVSLSSFVASKLHLPNTDSQSRSAMHSQSQSQLHTPQDNSRYNAPAKSTPISPNASSTATSPHTATPASNTNNLHNNTTPNSQTFSHISQSSRLSRNTPATSITTPTVLAPIPITEFAPQCGDLLFILLSPLLYAYFLSLHIPISVPTARCTDLPNQQQGKNSHGGNHTNQHQNDTNAFSSNPNPQTHSFSSPFAPHNPKRSNPFNNTQTVQNNQDNAHTGPIYFEFPLHLPFFGSHTMLVHFISPRPSHRDIDYADDTMADQTRGYDLAGNNYPTRNITHQSPLHPSNQSYSMDNMNTNQSQNCSAIHPSSSQNNSKKYQQPQRSLSHRFDTEFDDEIRGLHEPAPIASSTSGLINNPLRFTSDTIPSLSSGTHHVSTNTAQNGAILSNFTDSISQPQIIQFNDDDDDFIASPPLLSDEKLIKPYLTPIDHRMSNIEPIATMDDNAAPSTPPKRTTTPTTAINSSNALNANNLSNNPTTNCHIQTLSNSSLPNPPQPFIPVSTTPFTPTAPTPTNASALKQKSPSLSQTPSTLMHHATPRTSNSHNQHHHHHRHHPHTNHNSTHPHKPNQTFYSNQPSDKSQENPFLTTTTFPSPLDCTTSIQDPRGPPSRTGLDAFFNLTTPSAVPMPYISLSLIPHPSHTHTNPHSIYSSSASSPITRNHRENVTDRWKSNESSSVSTKSDLVDHEHDNDNDNGNGTGAHFDSQCGSMDKTTNVTKSTKSNKSPSNSHFSTQRMGILHHSDYDDDDSNQFLTGAKANRMMSKLTVNIANNTSSANRSSNQGNRSTTPTASPRLTIHSTPHSRLQGRYGATYATPAASLYEFGKNHNSSSKSPTSRFSRHFPPHSAAKPTSMKFNIPVPPLLNNILHRIVNTTTIWVIMTQLSSLYTVWSIDQLTSLIASKSILPHLRPEFEKNELTMGLFDVANRYQDEISQHQTHAQAMNGINPSLSELSKRIAQNHGGVNHFHAIHGDFHHAFSTLPPLPLPIPTSSSNLPVQSDNFNKPKSPSRLPLPPASNQSISSFSGGLGSDTHQTNPNPNSTNLSTAFRVTTSSSSALSPAFCASATSQLNPLFEELLQLFLLEQINTNTLDQFIQIIRHYNHSFLASNSTLLPELQMQYNTHPERLLYETAAIHALSNLPLARNCGQHRTQLERLYAMEDHEMTIETPLLCGYCVDMRKQIELYKSSHGLNSISSSLSSFSNNLNHRNQLALNSLNNISFLRVSQHDPSGLASHNAAVSSAFANATLGHFSSFYGQNTATSFDVALNALLSQQNSSNPPQLAELSWDNTDMNDSSRDLADSTPNNRLHSNPQSNAHNSKQLICANYSTYHTINRNVAYNQFEQYFTTTRNGSGNVISDKSNGPTGAGVEKQQIFHSCLSPCRCMDVFHFLCDFQGQPMNFGQDLQSSIEQFQLPDGSLEIGLFVPGNDGHSTNVPLEELNDPQMSLYAATAAARPSLPSISHLNQSATHTSNDTSRQNDSNSTFSTINNNDENSGPQQFVHSVQNISNNMTVQSGKVTPLQQVMLFSREFHNMYQNTTCPWCVPISRRKRAVLKELHEFITKTSISSIIRVHFPTPISGAVHTAYFTGEQQGSKIDLHDARSARNSTPKHAMNDDSSDFSPPTSSRDRHQCNPPANLFLTSPADDDEIVRTQQEINAASYTSPPKSAHSRRHSHRSSRTSNSTSVGASSLTMDLDNDGAENQENNDSNIVPLFESLESITASARKLRTSSQPVQQSQLQPNTHSNSTSSPSPSRSQQQLHNLHQNASLNADLTELKTANNTPGIGVINKTPTRTPQIGAASSASHLATDFSLASHRVSLTPTKRTTPKLNQDSEQHQQQPLSNVTPPPIPFQPFQYGLSLLHDPLTSQQYRQHLHTPSSRPLLAAMLNTPLSLPLSTTAKRVQEIKLTSSVNKLTAATPSQFTFPRPSQTNSVSKYPHISNSSNNAERFRESQRESELDDAKQRATLYNRDKIAPLNLDEDPFEPDPRARAARNNTSNAGNTGHEIVHVDERDEMISSAPNNYQNNDINDMTDGDNLSNTNTDDHENSDMDAMNDTTNPRTPPRSQAQLSSPGSKFITPYRGSYHDSRNALRPSHRQPHEYTIATIAVSTNLAKANAVSTSPPNINFGSPRTPPRRLPHKLTAPIHDSGLEAAIYRPRNASSPPCHFPFSHTSLSGASSRSQPHRVNGLSMEDQHVVSLGDGDVDDDDDDDDLPRFSTLQTQSSSHTLYDSHTDSESEDYLTPILSHSRMALDSNNSILPHASHVNLLLAGDDIDSESTEQTQDRASAANAVNNNNNTIGSNQNESDMND